MKKNETTLHKIVWVHVSGPIMNKISQAQNITSNYFIYVEKLILNLLWRGKRPRIAKTKKKKK